VSWYTSNILECQRDLSWLGAKLAWNLTEVPVEDSQITDELIKTVVGLVRVIEYLLAFIEFNQKVLVHFGHLEPFPEIGNTDCVISHIFESKKWVVALCLDGDEALFDDVLVIVLV